MKAAAIALFVGILAGCPAAWADQQEYVVETVCAPQAGYFSVQKRMVDNIDVRALNRLSASAHAVLTWPEALMRPSRCAIGGHVIALMTVTAKDASDCGRHPGWNVRIAWDDKTLACIDGDDPDWERRQSVTITLNGTRGGGDSILERCAVTLNPVDRDRHPPTDDNAGTLRCETTLFDPATGEAKGASARGRT